MRSLAGSGAVPAVPPALRRLIGRSHFLRRLGRALLVLTTRHVPGHRTPKAPAPQKPSVFDAEFYLSQVSPTECGGDPFEHYLTTGAARGLDPHPLFDTSYYCHKYPDVVQAGMNPLLHYLSFGLAEGRTPHPLFETSPIVIHKLDQRYSLYGKLFPDRYRHTRRWYSSDRPDVSIIVLAFNKSEFTVACLEAIWRHTSGAPYEVIVVDNGSEFRHIAAVAPHLYAGRLIALGTNRGFGEANNIGVEYAAGRYLFFLNNDAVVTDNWLAPLMDVLRDHRDAGAVGAKLVYPNGVLQEAGGLVLENGVTVQIGKGDDPQRPNYNVVTPVDYCSGAALLVSKSVFDRSLGFDFRYDPAYYEETDLCFKVRELGRKVYYCPGSVVVHHEGASSCEPTFNLGLHNVVETNRAKFLEKWQGHLRPRTYTQTSPEPACELKPGLPRSGVRAFGARPTVPAGGGRTVGLFCPFNIVPGGGEKYLLSIAEVAANFGPVDLITLAKYSRLRIANVAGELGLDIAALGLRTLSEIGSARPYDVFVSMSNEFLPPVRGQGNANYYICQFPFPIGQPTIEARSSFYRDYAGVFVYSHFVAEHLEREFTKHEFQPLPIQVLSPPIVPVPLQDPLHKRRIILSVGRFFAQFHNKKHVEMIRAFRRLGAEGGPPEWELHLAGAVHGEFEHREYFLRVLEEARGSHVRVHANPSAADLQRLYNDASIYWHATGFDEDLSRHPEKHEHFGMTTVEAMSAGCIPVVVGKGGPAEIVADGVNGFTWTTVDELLHKTRKVIELCERADGEIARLRDNARRRAADFGTDRFRERVKTLLHLTESAPQGGGSVWARRGSTDARVEFTCNVCDSSCSVENAAIHREIQSCARCGSTVRFRALVHILSTELFGQSLPLREFPFRRDLRGIGISDWPPLAEAFQASFDYTNTFQQKEPRLDIANVDESLTALFDFIIVSDVFEHLAPPVSRAFENSHRLLKPSGILLLTVPYRTVGTTVEHFPELHQYTIVDTNGRRRLLNRTRDGRQQEFDDLVFHGDDGVTLEMRMFTLPSLLELLTAAGFSDIKVRGEDCERYGIYWPTQEHLPLVARKHA